MLEVLPREGSEFLLSSVVEQLEGPIRSPALPFIHHSIRQSEKLLTDCVIEKKALQEKLTAATGDYRDAKERCAVLVERLGSATRVGVVSNLVMSLGGVILGIGLQSYDAANRSKITEGEIGLGILLMLLSWGAEFFPGGSKGSKGLC